MVEPPVLPHPPVDAQTTAAPPGRASVVSSVAGPRRVAGGGARGFTSAVHAFDLVSLGTGVLLAARWAGQLPAAAVGAVMVVAVLAPRWHRWRFTLSVLDELPSAVALFATITMATASVLLLTGQPAAASGALRAGVVVTSAVLLGRMVAYAVIRRLRCRGIGLASAVVLGSDATGTRLASGLAGNPAYGVRLLGFVDDAMSLLAYPAPQLGTVEALEDIVLQYEVDLVLVAFDAYRGDAVTDSLRQLFPTTCQVYFVPRLFELGGRFRPDELVDGTPLMQLRRSAFRYPWWPVKRVLDVVIAACGLIVTSPLIAAVALAVRREMGPGVIFRQQRVGMDGKPFTLYKFRSFVPLGNEDETRWSIDGDPRLRPVGRFIRTTSLDELPQLVNVLKGQMSVVGPRPERPFYVEKFTPTVPGYRHRHRVPVGLTGYAAVNGLRGDTSITDRVLFDNLYADSWSLWLDIKIILRTFCGCVSGRWCRPRAPGSS